MSKPTLLLAITALFTSYAQAATGPATVEIFESIGVGSIQFEGATANRLYNELKVQPVQIADGFQKVGQNLSCFSKKRDKGTSTRCGMNFITESGLVEPDQIATPTPGTTVSN
ncbi:MAG: hypothetical protein EOP09_11190 [Proteobacteria bacterium]|nr:MAG: hypothetical protein EOP09_11190 [Pseudomonadota bacterium]